jgi:hypothetical protein
MSKFSKEFLAASDRETVITFVSLLAASYAWIVAEELFLGIAIGIAMHAIQVAAYEYLAARNGWKRLHVADAFRAHVLPHLLRIISKAQRA